MTIIAREAPVMTREIEHIYVPALPGDPIAQACRLHERALSCRDQGRLEEAGRLAWRALEILERELGPDDPDVANVLLCLPPMPPRPSGSTCARWRSRRRSWVRIIRIWP